MGPRLPSALASTLRVSLNFFVRGVGARETAGCDPAGKISRAVRREILKAELKDGTAVECRRLELSGAEFLALGVELPDAIAGERRKEDVEAELRQTVGWMTEGVGGVWTKPAAIRAANEHFYRMVGLSPEEAAGMRTLDELLDLVSSHASDPREFARRWRHSRICGKRRARKS